MPATMRSGSSTVGTRSRTDGSAPEGWAAAPPRLALGMEDRARCQPRRDPAAASSSSRRTVALGGALDLDEPALAGHHHVHVGLGAGVLDVGQVEHGTPSTTPTVIAANSSSSGGVDRMSAFTSG